MSSHFSFQFDPQRDFRARFLRQASELIEGNLGVPGAKSLGAFFQLVRSFKDEPSLQHRISFWLELLKHHQIHQVWLILTPELAEKSRSVLGEDVDSFGILQKSKHVEALHGVLLMRIHHLVVAEWSHIGKCRCWVQSNPHVPKMFENEYRSADLREHTDYVQQHYFSKSGRWQKDLLTFFQESGIILDVK